MFTFAGGFEGGLRRGDGKAGGFSARKSKLSGVLARELDADFGGGRPMFGKVVAVREEVGGGRAGTEGEGGAGHCLVLRAASLTNCAVEE